MATDGPTEAAGNARLVVGLGASAGGLEALEELVPVLPTGAQIAYLLVQHPDPDHDSELVRRLAPRTELEVVEAEHQQALRADTLYVIPSGVSMTVMNGAIELGDPAMDDGGRLPVTALFRSLAREVGPRAVGIVLSGTGSDGSDGIRELKVVGGLTMAQDPETAVHGEMPETSIRTGAVDYITEPRKMGELLSRFARLPSSAFPESLDAEPEEVVRQFREESGILTPDDIEELGEILERQQNFDIRVYKAGTIERRVLRRMLLGGFENSRRFLEHLRRDRELQRALIRDLLISVTEFYREPGAFHALRELVLEPLVRRAPPDATLRCWVPGCATGEEAYSLCIELLDIIATENKPLGIRIFATDIDESALKIARTGLYPADVSAQIASRHLARYFVPVEGRGYRVRPEVRDCVSFSLHDLSRDPPFSRMALVSCRNVFIYLRPEVQQRVLAALHFALDSGGTLFLGPAESIAAHPNLFAPRSKKWRIFEKSGVSRSMPMPRYRGRIHGIHRRHEAGDGPDPESVIVSRKREQYRRAVMAAVLPPTVVVDRENVVIFMHGELHPDLQLPQGDDLRFELGALISEGISTRTRSVVYRCRRDGETVIARIRTQSGEGATRITARPAPELADGTVILTFEREEDEHAAVEPEGGEGQVSAVVLDQLESELQATRLDLRNTVEELESSNEELRSANEESLSINEELQSANEELEATTEELRSLNEELATVNAELRDKVEALETASDRLRAAEERLRLAQDAAGLGIYDHDLRAGTLRWDERMREMWGLRHDEEITYETFIGCVHPDDRRRVESAIDRAKDPSRRHFRIEHRVIGEGDDVCRWVSIAGSVSFENGQAVRLVGAVQDITERVEGAASQARLAAIVESSDDAIVSKSLDGVIRSWNRGAEELFGYSAEEAVGQSIVLIIPETLYAEELDILARLRRGERIEELETTRVRKDGTRIDVRLNISPIRNEMGDVIGASKIARDNTERKRAAEALRQSEARFRLAIEGSPVSVYENDSQLRYNWVVNPVFGLSVDEVIGRRDDELLPPRAAEELMAVKRKVLESGETERRLFAPEIDGKNYAFDLTVEPAFDDQGGIAGVRVASADVSALRAAEQKVAESEERFRTLADNIAQLAWMADGDGTIFWYNKRWYDYTGTTFEELQGEGWRRVHHPDHVERVAEKITGCFASGEFWEDTFPLRRADGSYGWFLSRALPIRDDSGTIVRWFGTNTDITVRREAEERLREADRRKDEFLAVLGHELRNPLAAISNATELLRFGEGDGRLVRRAAAVLGRQTRHMGKLIDGLLEVSRIAQGKILVELEIIDLRDAMTTVLEDQEQHAAGAGLTLHSALPATPVWIAGDHVRLVQVLDNLVSNAIKFTDSGGTVTVSLSQDASLASLCVRDTGMGIRPAMLGRIFEPFQQEAQDLARSTGGLGLGLALAKGIVELHGGSIEARSAGLGTGSQFWITLPLVDPPAAERESSPARARRRRILVVEDNHDAGVMLAALLETRNHEVEVVHCGEDALERLKGSSFDVVLCDLGLPGMNGYEIATTIRQDPQHAGLLLVAVSGYGQPEDKQRAASAGFDEHIIKPLELAELEHILESLDDRS